MHTVHSSTAAKVEHEEVEDGVVQRVMPFTPVHSSTAAEVEHEDVEDGLVKRVMPVTPAA